MGPIPLAELLAPVLAANSPLDVGPGWMPTLPRSVLLLGTLSHNVCPLCLLPLLGLCASCLMGIFALSDCLGTAI